MQDLRQGKMLAQVHAPNTAAYTIYTKSVKTSVCIKSITVCNTDEANAVTFSIFCNVAGSTLNNTCALYSTAALAAATTQIIEWPDGLYFKEGVAGALGVQASAANVVTFTVMGAEF